jgi:hypothetical protein
LFGTCCIIGGKDEKGKRKRGKKVERGGGEKGKKDDERHAASYLPFRLLPF